MLKFKIIFSVLWICVTCSHAEMEVEESEDVIVEGQRRDVAEISPELTPVFMESIDIKALRSRPLQLEEVLEQRTGVQIRRFGGPGTYSSISLRGATAGQVSIFIDGVPLNQAAKSEVDLSGISLETLESIEVYRGMAPAKFGVSPIGGVVNLITRKISKEPSAEVKSHIGSFGTLSGALYMSVPAEDWVVSVHADKLHSDGDFEYIDDRRTPNNTSDDLTKKRLNNDVTRDSWMVKASLPQKNNRRFDFSHQVSEKFQGLPGRGNNQTRHVRFRTNESISQMKVTFSDPFTTNSGLSLNLSRTDNKERYADLFGASGELGLGSQLNFYHYQQNGGRVIYEWSLSRHLFELSYGFAAEDYMAVEHLSAIQPGDSRRITHSLSVQDQLDFYSGRLLVVPALKYVGSRSHYGSTTGITGVSATENSENDLNWQLGVKSFLREDLEWKANVGSSERDPTFFELFGDRGNRLGNASLTDEKSLNWDMGLSYTPWLDIQWISDARISFGYFESHKKDLIQMVFDARGVGQAENIAKAKTSGIEAGFGLDFFKGFSFEYQLTLLDSEIESSRFPFEVGKRIPGLYEYNSSSKLSYEFRDVRVYTEWLVQEDMFYDRSNLLRAADKEIFNLGLTYQYKQHEAVAEVKNLSDDRIEDYSGWPLPGRSYHLTFRTVF